MLIKVGKNIPDLNLNNAVNFDYALEHRNGFHQSHCVMLFTDKTSGGNQCS
jgi:hypothetical protein